MFLSKFMSSLILVQQRFLIVCEVTFLLKKTSLFHFRDVKQKFVHFLRGTFSFWRLLRGSSPCLR